MPFKNTIVSSTGSIPELHENRAIFAEKVVKWDGFFFGLVKGDWY